MKRAAGLLGATFALTMVAVALPVVASASETPAHVGALPSPGAHRGTGTTSATPGSRSPSPAPRTATPNVVVPSTWSIVPSPNAAAVSSALEGVSCTGTSFCVAVGRSYNPDNNQTLIERWAGTAWSIVPSPNTATDKTNLLSSVSCTSAVSCTAVGYFSDAGNYYQTLVEQWDGTAWSIVASPNTDATHNNVLNAVSCTSSTFCVAVGYSRNGANDQTLIEQWNGAAWSIVSTPDISTSYSTLASVSCVSASFCEAVGYSEIGTYTQTLIEQWNGAAWAVVASPNPGSQPGSALIGVSCFSTTMCVAVGNSASPSAFVNLVEQWNGTAWKVATVPDADAVLGDLLITVDCFGPTSCVAGGWANTTPTGDNYVSQVLTWNGTTWALATIPNPVSTTPEDQINGLSCIAAAACIGVGYGTTGSAGIQTLALSAPVTRSGYYEVASDGGLFAYGASFYGSMGGKPLNQPVVGMAVAPDRGGYYEVASDGGLFAFGDAIFYGSMGGKPLNQPVVGIASTPDGRGYWEVASDGGLFAFGDATFYGSMGGKPLNQPVVGIAATPDGRGYWEVASDGGLFAFGDATFYGSMGGKPLNQPVVGIAVAPEGGGYYEVATDGGLFAFGNATFYGSMGGKPLNRPVVGMSASPTGGYYEVASDGGLFAFGAPFLGSMGGKSLNQPVVAIAT